MVFAVVFLRFFMVFMVVFAFFGGFAALRRIFAKKQKKTMVFRDIR